MGDLSKNFSKHEFDCRCNNPNCSGKNPPDSGLVSALQELRDSIGVPLYLTTHIGKNGGNRCVDQNKKAGGVSRSQHLHNRAADCYVEGMSPKDLAHAAVKIAAFKNGGIGLGNTVCHLDVRGWKARWSYGDIVLPDWLR